jgi:phosphatidate cytidylyltransferase
LIPREECGVLVKRIVTAVVLIPIVLLLVLRAPVPVVATVTAAIAVLTAHEFLKLTESYGVAPFRKPTYAAIILFFLLLMFNAGQGKPLLSTEIFGVAAALAAAIVTFVFLAIAMRRDNLSTGYPAAAASSFAFAYIALPLAMLVQLRQQWAGAFLILYLLLVVWSGDIFAYFVGKSIGRNLMAPRISPKKTWEGAAASLVASIAIGSSLLYYASEVSTRFLQWGLIQRRDGMFGLERPALVPILMLTAILNIAAQLGDLVESLIKRGANVKDSGAILPGHGGMLDRIDALLFAAPVLWIWAAWRVMQ